MIRVNKYRLWMQDRLLWFICTRMLPRDCGNIVRDFLGLQPRYFKCYPGTKIPIQKVWRPISTNSWRQSLVIKRSGEHVHRNHGQCLLCKDQLELFTWRLYKLYPKLADRVLQKLRHWKSFHGWLSDTTDTGVQAMVDLIMMSEQAVVYKYRRPAKRLTSGQSCLRMYAPASAPEKRRTGALRMLAQKRKTAYRSQNAIDSSSRVRVLR
jgi:hypothetical protein